MRKNPSIGLKSLILPDLPFLGVSVGPPSAEDGEGFPLTRAGWPPPPLLLLAIAVVVVAAAGCLSCCLQ